MSPIPQSNEIHVYQKRWRLNAKSTQPVARSEAREVVEELYRNIDLASPRIIFCNSPFQVLKGLSEAGDIENFVEISLLGIDLVSELANEIGEDLGKKIFEAFEEFTEIDKLNVMIEQSLLRVVNDRRKERMIEKCLKPGARCETFCVIDFCVSALSYPISQEWQVVKKLVQSCGWIFPFKDICFICERPRKLLFNNDGELHAISEPAIEFPDGFSIYVNHDEVVRDVFPAT
ncbi:DUF6745 domain-containing protein [Lusitaniella coriacea]|uniref:DUF6745 domain-containing protein n=1 Tax=Lusitaniella coriacea TaxID=1983105 RepID=UPI003CF730FA